MKKLTAITAAILIASYVPAAAGSLADVGLDDPTVAGDSKPVCLSVLWIFPCHAGFDYEEPEGDEPRGVTVTIRDTVPDREDEPEQGCDY